MIRILFYGLSSNQGGIENYLLKICTHLNKEEFNIAFIDENGGKACHRERLEKLGAAFFDITHRKVSLRKNKEELKKLFQQEKFDILHFNCNTLSYIEPIVQARRQGVKIVLHSRSSKAPSRMLTKALHYVNRLKITKWNIVRLAVSELAGRWLFRNEEYIVLNNGIEIERYIFDFSKRESTRRELGIENKTVYGNVGAFLEAKNHEFVLEIFEKIHMLDKNTVLLLVGDGKLKEKYQKEVGKKGLSSCIYFLGSRKDVPDLLMAMDCMIFPSLYEGFPNAVLEAETTGLPVIMSDLVTREIAIQNTCRFLSLKENAEDWAQIAMELASIGIEDRNEKYKNIEDAGLSVRNEIVKLENIYKRALA